MIWDNLLETALLTPSPHNVQPWKLKIRSDTDADLYIDSARTLPMEDVTGDFMRCAMGMFIESLRLAAANHALSLIASIVPETTGAAFVPFAHLRLEKGTSQPSDYPHALFLARMTSRLPNYRVPVSATDESFLSRFSTEAGHEFRLVRDPSSIETILSANIDAIFRDLNHPPYHDEIVEWFRFSESESARHRDGLDYRCMIVPPAEFWLSARFPQILRWPGVNRLMKRMYVRQLGHVETIGVLSGAFFDREKSVDTGAFLLRFWLELARRGLYIHPFGNLVTNKTAAGFMGELMGLTKIWLVFRIGTTAVPPRSYRKAKEDLVLAE